MARARSLATLIALAMTLAAPTWAQDTGSIISKAPPASVPDGTMSEAEKARVTIIQYAVCLVGRRPAIVKRALAAYIDEASTSAFGQLTVSECLADSAQLAFPSSLLRGPLYMALYRREFSGREPAILAEPIDFAAKAGIMPDNPKRDEFVALHGIADCVVRADPALARAAVLAPVRTSAETAAYAAVAPRLANCLPGGQQFRFNRLILGGLLAEALYLDTAATATDAAKKG